MNHLFQRVFHRGNIAGKHYGTGKSVNKTNLDCTGFGGDITGKTSLIQRLRGEALNYQKTQSIIWQDNAIDTPGEYLENRCLYSALLASACEADVVGLVQNADATQSWFAPMLAQVFNKPVIGIISKADTVSHTDQLGWAADCLTQAGDRCRNLQHFIRPHRR